MSTNTVDAGPDDQVAGVNKEVTPKFGLGSGTALTGVIGLWITAIIAALNAGETFYQDGTIQGYFITAGAATLAFLGLRLPRVQFGVNKARTIHDEVEAKYQMLIAEYEAQLAQFKAIVSEIENEQDNVPDELRDEVTTEPPGDEATDAMKPPA